MKIHRPREEGNTLLVVLLITGLIVAALGSYLNLALTEHKTVHRSLAWNAALPLAEAGVEEALSHLNKNRTNLAADGWTTNYLKHRSLGRDYFDVHFDGSPGGLVTIYATGAVQWLDGTLGPPMGVPYPTLGLHTTVLPVDAAVAEQHFVAGIAPRTIRLADRLVLSEIPSIGGDEKAAEKGAGAAQRGAGCY